MTTGTSGVRRALSRCDSVTSPIRQTLSSSGSADPAERDEGLRGCKAKATPATHRLASRRTLKPPPARCRSCSGPWGPAWLAANLGAKHYRAVAGSRSGRTGRATWPLTLAELEEATATVGAEASRVVYGGAFADEGWPVLLGFWDRRHGQVWMYNVPPMRQSIRQVLLAEALPACIRWVESGLARGDGWRLLEHWIEWRWENGELRCYDEPRRYGQR